MSLVTNIDKIFKKGVIGNVRKAQEDSHDIALKTPNGDVFVVCDGMGGHVGGAKASGLAVECIIKSLEKERYDDPIQALNDALQFANMQILGFANDHPEYHGMGTTACIVLMRDNDVWIAHVGDSRIYLYLGKEKELHRITKDHSFVQTLVDVGEITDEEAEHHPNKNRILKALGIKPEMQPSFNHLNYPIHPKNGDVFLICSDGLSGMIPDTTIEQVLAQDNVTIEKKGEMLIQLAMQGETVQPGGQDNCTVELICVDNSPWQNSEFQSFNPAGRPRHDLTQSNNLNVAAASPTSGASATPSTSASSGSKTSTDKSGTGKRLNIKIIAIACIAVALIVGGILLWSRGGGDSKDYPVAEKTEEYFGGYDGEDDRYNNGVPRTVEVNPGVFTSSGEDNTKSGQDMYGLKIEDGSGKQYIEKGKVKENDLLFASVRNSSSGYEFHYSHGLIDEGVKDNYHKYRVDGTKDTITISYGPSESKKREKISLLLEKTSKENAQNTQSNSSKGSQQNPISNIPKENTLGAATQDNKNSVATASKDQNSGSPSQSSATKPEEKGGTYGNTVDKDKTKDSDNESVSPNGVESSNHNQPNEQKMDEEFYKLIENLNKIKSKQNREQTITKVYNSLGYKGDYSKTKKLKDDYGNKVKEEKLKYINAIKEVMESE